jgi:hypothetical protein
MAGDEVADLSQISRNYNWNWDNTIAKVVVEPGCTFKGFQFRQFNVREDGRGGLTNEGMPHANETYLSNRDGYECSERNQLYGRDYKTISSYKCWCEHEYRGHRHHHHYRDGRQYDNEDDDSGS